MGIGHLAGHVEPTGVNMYKSLLVDELCTTSSIVGELQCCMNPRAIKVTTVCM